jgi:hypothetical protein
MNKLKNFKCYIEYSLENSLNSTLQLFGPACFAYLLSAVRPMVELKYLEVFGLKKLQSQAKEIASNQHMENTLEPLS